MAIDNYAPASGDLDIDLDMEMGMEMGMDMDLDMEMDLEGEGIVISEKPLIHRSASPLPHTRSGALPPQTLAIPAQQQQQPGRWCRCGHGHGQLGCGRGNGQIVGWWEHIAHSVH